MGTIWFLDNPALAPETHTCTQQLAALVSPSALLLRLRHPQTLLAEEPVERGPRRVRDRHEQPLLHVDGAREAMANEGVRIGRARPHALVEVALQRGRAQRRAERAERGGGVAGRVERRPVLGLLDRKSVV